ncbi:MAG TPA: DUF669 domain-containing protein [Planctomycetota bacterium]|nr:DUF669 domain-containing protein [Planctomycetota bacterium]
MEIDFDAVDHVSDFITVPPGTYLCRVGEVRPGTTRAGDERWSLRLVVAEGQHVGKQAAWDSLVFSVRGRARARQVFHALGLPAQGRVTVEPSDLEGRQALVEVRPVEYANPSGEVVRRNEVPYDGFKPVPGAQGSGAQEPAPKPRPQGGGGKGRKPQATATGDAADDQVPF